MIADDHSKLAKDFQTFLEIFVVVNVLEYQTLCSLPKETMCGLP